MSDGHKEGMVGVPSTRSSASVGCSMRIRFVMEAHERQALYRLRYGVYVVEQGKEYVQANHDERLLRDDADDYAGACLLVTVNGQPVATVRTTHLQDVTAFATYRERFDLDRYHTIPHKDMVVCSRLAILPPYWKTCVVQVVFEAVYRYGAERVVRFCFQYCAPALVPLFAHYGFLEYAPPVEDPILGRAHRMRLVLDDFDHLQRVKSPFYAIDVELKRGAAGRDPWSHADGHGGGMRVPFAGT